MHYHYYNYEHLNDFEWILNVLLFSVARDDVNKAFRKLSVLLHPDKSVAPGSEEAFKILVAARTSLLQVVSRWPELTHGLSSWLALRINWLEKTSLFLYDRWILEAWLVLRHWLVLEDLLVQEHWLVLDNWLVLGHWLFLDDWLVFRGMTGFALLTGLRTLRKTNRF